MISKGIVLLIVIALIAIAFIAVIAFWDKTHEVMANRKLRKLNQKLICQSR